MLQLMFQNPDNFCINLAIFDFHSALSSGSKKDLAFGI